MMTMVLAHRIKKVILPVYVHDVYMIFIMMLSSIGLGVSENPFIHSVIFQNLNHLILVQNTSSKAGDPSTHHLEISGSESPSTIYGYVAMSLAPYSIFDGRVIPSMKMVMKMGDGAHDIATYYTHMSLK